MGKLEVNRVLFTRDGRKIGNAIISFVSVNEIKIITDYGNTVTLNNEGIFELFHEEANENVQFFVDTHKHFTAI
jgi:hypothetical protein